MTARVQRAGVIRRLAPLGLMPAGALAVHQLRYWLAFHGAAGAELQRQGHSYLHSLVPWIVLGLAVAAGVFVRTLGRAFGGRVSVSRHTVSFLALWLISAATLVAIYVCQEFLEGLFATGHPAGLAGVFAYGGWWSIPAAVLVGLVLTAAFHGARWVLREVAQRFGDRAARSRALPAPRRPVSVVLAPRLAPLADGWSVRGPPSR
jgi:hypothetical protein